MTKTRNFSIINGYYFRQTTRIGASYAVGPKGEVNYFMANPSIPRDYSGELSELLPQLVETYGVKQVREYMSQCSAALDQVDKLNAVLSSSENNAPDFDRNKVMDGVMSATSAYYNFLMSVPEDMRRFLFLMGGVSPQEVDSLSQIEPDVGDAITQLAGIAPAIQAIRPKNYVMPIDPISNKLATLQELNQVVVSNRKKPPIKTSVSIDCPEHMKIDGNISLTTYDRSLINGVVSILESGNSSFTIGMLYQAMTGVKNPTVDENLVEELKTKLDTMRRLSITIDLTNEVKAHMIHKEFDAQVDQFSIEGYLLPLNKYSGTVNGKKSEMYQIIDTPPLYSYAKLKNQITTVPLDLLKAPLNNNSTTIPLKTYLLGRIEAMKNTKNSVFRDKILYKTIYSELGELTADKKRKARIRKYTCTILSYFVQQKYITSFREVKEGNAITHLIIDYAEPKN